MQDGMPFKLVTKDYDYYAPLTYGEVLAKGLQLDYERDTARVLDRTLTDPSIHAGEIPFGRYINAIAGGGSPFVGLPVFPGRAFRHRCIFVRRDSGLERLSDLEGRTIAFQNTASTSAYFAPATALLDAGQRLEILLSPMDRPSADAVGYVFARSELNIAAWVHKRLVDAGVVSNLDWDDVRRMPPAFRHDFRVIHETQDFPRALEMVRGDLDPKIEARLREVLLEAAQDPAAREALSVFFRTTRFLPVDPASQQALDDLRRGVTRVREQLE